MGSLVVTGTTSRLEVPKVLSQEVNNSLQLTHSILKSGNGRPVSTVVGIACCLLLSMSGHLMELILSEGPVVKIALNCQHGG